MSRRLGFTPLLFVLVTACDADDPEEDSGSDGGDPSADCAPQDDPAQLTITDVAPAPGSTVPNVDVVHRFVIADSPGLFSSLVLVMEAGHTAGTFDSTMPQFTVVPQGDDLEYTLQPVQWGEVGHVKMSITGGFVDDEGCAYEFPPSIFDYELAAP